MTRHIASRSVLAIAVALLVPLAARAHASPATSAGATTAHAQATMPAHVGAAAMHAHAHHGPAAMEHAKIDINAATETQLETLPGIDAATAQKIVEGRPYKSTRQLVSKEIVTEEEFVKLEGRIIARPVAAESHAKDGADMKSMPKHHGSLEGHAH